MRDPDELFAPLARNKFRSCFRLGAKETAYPNKKILAVALKPGVHAPGERPVGEVSAHLFNRKN